MRVEVRAGADQLEAPFQPHRRDYRRPRTVVRSRPWRRSCSLGSTSSSGASSRGFSRRIGSSRRDSVDSPDLVIADISRIEPEEVADAWPDIPIMGFTNHTDRAGLQRAHTAGFDQVIVKSALVERAAEIVDELTGATEAESGRLTALVRLDGDDVHHRRALHRHQRPLVRRRLPGRLHPRVRADPDHRPGGVHRLLRALRAAHHRPRPADVRGARGQLVPRAHRLRVQAGVREAVPAAAARRGSSSRRRSRSATATAGRG